MQMVWKGAVTSPGKALGKVVRIRKISPVNLDEKSSLNREMTLARVAGYAVNAKKVLVVGVGRVLISLKSCVKRWKHL